MSNPQPQGSQAQPQPRTILKPEDLPKLSSLTEDQKAKYKVAFGTIVGILNSKPDTSNEYIQARNKLQEWSSRLIHQERVYRQQKQQQQLKGSNQNPQGQQANQSSQPPQPSQPPQSNQPTQQSQGPSLPSSDHASDTAPGDSAQAQHQKQQPMPQLQAQNQAPGAAPPQSGNRPQVPPSNEHAQIIKHVNEFPWRLGPGVPVVGPDAEKRFKEMRQSYLNALVKQNQCSKRLSEINRTLQQNQQQGIQPLPELLGEKQRNEAGFLGAKRFVDELRKKQGEWKAQGLPVYNQTQSQQQPQQQPQPVQAQPQATTQQQTPQQPQTAPSTIEKPEPQIKVEPGQTQPAQPFTNIPGGIPQSQQNAQATGASIAQPPPRQPPVPHPQQQQLPPHAHPSFPQPGQQPHQPQRPQINPQQANAAIQQQTNSPHPHSAVSAGPGGPPVPLSHHAAVSAAQRSYSNPDPQRTGTPLQPGQGNFHPPGSREREQLNNTKMPIPRTLNTATPVPVSMGPARPTMGGPNNGAPGPLGQPVINKFPPFQLEGEGDRVLSKRKLDELVRQVTGGSEDALTPEVEEAMLQLADDFVDTVITSACKLAKLRESPNLEIRDLQVVLERNYNIRIPGYASDEVRTVRKVVPAPGWTQKMNAVQAAKVMGGKSDI